MAGTLPESPRSRQSAGERRTARGNGERDRRNDWRLSCRPVANQAGSAGGPIDGAIRGGWELNGVGADSLSQKGASSLDHILGLVADHECRRPVTEVGVHATKPGADGLVIFLRAKELDNVQGVLQRGSSLSARDVLAACPAANGFGIFYAGYDSDQPLAQEFLEGGGCGRDALAGDASMRVALQVGKGFRHGVFLVRDYHKTTYKTNALAYLETARGNDRA